MDDFLDIMLKRQTLGRAITHNPYSSKTLKLNKQKKSNFQEELDKISGRF